MKRFFKRMVTSAAIYYAVCVVIFSFITMLTNTGEDRVGLDPLRVICMLPFCICFATANTAMTYKNIEAFTRWLMHALLTIAGSFVFLILPAELAESSANFMGLVLIFAAYVIGALVYALISVRIRKAIAEDKKLSAKKTK